MSLIRFGDRNIVILIGVSVVYRLLELRLLIIKERTEGELEKVEVWVGRKAFGLVVWETAGRCGWGGAKSHKSLLSETGSKAEQLKHKSMKHAGRGGACILHLGCKSSQIARLSEFKVRLDQLSKSCLKLGMVVCACNPSTLGAAAGRGRWVQNQPILCNEFQAIRGYTETLSRTNKQ